MLKKVIRRSSYIAVPVIALLVSANYYVHTDLFKNNIKYILKSSVNLNIDFTDLKLKNFRHLEIENLLVKDREGNDIIVAKKVDADINLLTPSRLNNIVITDGSVLLERYKEGINLEKLIDLSPSTTYIKRTNLGKVSFNNVDLKYIDHTFKKPIERDFKVTGSLVTNNKYSLRVLGDGNSINNENINLSIELINSNYGKFDVFSNEKNTEQMKLKFKFKDVNLDEDVSQFTNISDLIVAKSGKLDGYIDIDIDLEKDDLNLYGDLYVNKANVKYADYKGKIEDAIANIKLNKKDILVKGKNKDVSLDLNFNLKSEDLGLKLKTRNLPYQELKKYKLIENFNIDGVSAPVKLSLDFGMNLKKQKITKLEGNIKSAYFNAFGLNTNNVDVDLGLKKEDIVNVKVKNLGVTKEVNKDINLDLRTNVNLDFNLKNAEFNGRYSGINNTKNVKVDKFAGTFKNDKNKNILATLNADTLKSNILFNPKRKTVEINSQSSDKIGFEYQDKTYFATLNSKKLIFSLDKKEFVGGNISTNVNSPDFESYFKDINATIEVKNGQYLLSTVANTDEGAINLNGLVNKDFSVDINADTKNFDINKYLHKNFNVSIGDPEKTQPLFEDINANVKYKNGVFDIDALLNNKDEKINIIANLKDKENQSYEVRGQNVNFNTLTKKIGFEDKIFKGDSKFDFDAKFAGGIDNLAGDFAIKSKYGESAIDYENLSAVGKINNLKDLDVELDLEADEIWLQYQRFLGIKSHIDIKDGKIVAKLNDSKNKIKANALYNIKEDNLDFIGQVNAYNLYTTNLIDTDIVLNNLKFDIHGPLNKLNGKVSVDPSPVLIKEKKIGDLTLNAEIKDNKVNLEGVKLRDYKISGTYDLISRKFDAGINLVEKNIQDILSIKDIGLSVETDIKAFGTLDDVNLDAKLNIKDVRYADYQIPEIVLDAEYRNGNIANIRKTGLLDVKNFEIKDSKGNRIFEFNNKFDLANLDIDYNISNKKIKLEDIGFLDSNKFKGEITLGVLLKYNDKEFLSSLKVNGDDIVLNDLNVNNLALDIQSTDTSVNISEAYLEYEDNPLILDGFLTYPFKEYSLRLLASDFNLEFLGINDNVEASHGIANADVYLTNKEFKGQLDLKDFVYKLKNKAVDIKDLNSDIEITSTDVNINKLEGMVNGGNVDISGKLGLPKLDSDFLKTKNLTLGGMNLSAKLDGVNIAYKKDLTTKITTNLVLRDNKINGKVVFNNASLFNIPSTKTGSKPAVKVKETITDSINDVLYEIGKNILNQYLVDVSIETERPIKIKIPSVSGILKDIKGDVFANAKVNIKNSNITSNLDVNISKGSFTINNHNFVIEEAIVSNVGEINPSISFKATTIIDDDIIDIIIDGNLKDKNIRIISSQGKNINELLGLLAFDKAGGILQAETLKASSLAGKALETTLNNIIFSSVTNSISSILGLNDLKIKANFKTDGNIGLTDILNNTSTTVSIREKLFKLDNVYWNGEVTIPFDFRLDSFKNRLKYSLGLSYFIKNGLSATVGIRKPIIEIPKNPVAVYGGLEYSNRYNDFDELFEDLRLLFNSKTKLKK